MKVHHFKSSNPFAGLFRWLCPALLLLSSHLLVAQQNQAERWLFVFDLSSQMKKDLPATAIALEQMLSTGANGQLHAGDSVGIWTYDQQLHAGEVPLFGWKPDRAAIITSNMVAYLKRQRYRDDSSLAAVQSFLPQVVAHSTRLTTVVFCDGNSLLRGTPYDDGVNQSFHDSLAERKKSHQPFVLVLRSQLGKYVNCTVAYPPGNINLPPFPELPPSATHKQDVAKAAAKEQAKAPAVPPLVIIGTKVSTNLNAKAETTEAKASAPVVATTNISSQAAGPPTASTTATPTNLSSVRPVPASKPVVTMANPEVKSEAAETASVPPSTNVTLSPNTNATLTSSSVASPTNMPENAGVETLTTQTTAVAASEKSSTQQKPPGNADDIDHQSRILIWLGAGLIAAAGVLVVLLIVRPGKRPRGSLISSSMQDDNRLK